MLQANFTITPSAGFVNATQFTVTNLTTASNSIWKYIWNTGFSNELIYNTTSPVFTYPYPGTYTVGLTATDYDGNSSTFKQSVYIDLAYRDYVTFTKIPEQYASPGAPTLTPFEVSFISTDINNIPVIDLYAANSVSTPYQFVPNKWGFLTPTWYFTDTNSNIVTSVTATPVPLYVNNTVVAVSGSVQFYYIDSKSAGNPINNTPVLITATLQTSGFTNPNDSNIYSYPSYANNETVRTGLIWLINDPLPSYLKVTANYLHDIDSYQYNGIKIPFLVTCHSDRSLVVPGSKSYTSNVLFSYPTSNTVGNKDPIQITLSGIDSSLYTIEDTSLYFQSLDQNYNDIGGYIFTGVTVLSSIDETAINVNALVYSGDVKTTDVFPYPHGYSPNTSIWVSNPEQNTLNKITLTPYNNDNKTIEYFKNKGLLIEGYIKEVQVPSLTGTSTFNYNLTGFSGIYSMAIDPIDYSVVAADTELNCLYRFDNTGNLINKYSFDDYGSYNVNELTFKTWQFNILDLNFYDSVFKLDSYIDGVKQYVSTNPNNFIVAIDGVVQPTSLYVVSDNTLRFTSYDSLPPGSVTLSITQIFSPQLPDSYISSICYWNFTVTDSSTIVYNLGNSASLNSDSNYYIVTIDGIMQSPSSYTIDTFSNSIVFVDTNIPANVPVQIWYLPSLTNPTTQTYNLSTPSNTIFLSNNIPITNVNTNFLINIGGVYQDSLTYELDTVNQSLLFDSILPANTDIFITLANSKSLDYSPAGTPVSVSLDKNSNIWVSLFNSAYVLKFDSNFNLLFATSPYELTNISPLAEFDSDYLLKPPVLETDKNNNCWVTYSHPLCSLLIQYNLSGTPINLINLNDPLPTNLSIDQNFQYSVPVSLAIDQDNNIWVANSYNVLSADGDIRLYDSKTLRVKTVIPNITRPSDITLTRKGNIWFTHSIRGLGYYDIVRQELYLWSASRVGDDHLTLKQSPGLPGNINEIIDPDELVNMVPGSNIPILNNYSDDEEFSGIAVDVYDRLWVIDSYKNTAWVYLSAIPAAISNEQRIIKIQPNNTIGYYLNNNAFTYTESGNFNYQSAQAAGDWTGNKWYQKYTSLSSLSSISISGTSVPFKVKDFINENQITILNNSFNTAEHYHSLALPENLHSNKALFEQFLPAVVGNGTVTNSQDLGKTVYEKIANFVQNHSDIDTCNISQLLSLAAATDVIANEYVTDYPFEIRDMVNTLSISKAKLIGVNEITSQILQNTGNKYNTTTDYVTADSTIIAQNAFDKSIQIIKVPKQNLTTVYPLSSFIGYGLIQPITQNYNFYNLGSYNNNFFDSIIDWNSDQTTLYPTMSTFEDWYGDNGIVENTFRYLLTKNLFLK